MVQEEKFKDTTAVGRYLVLVCGIFCLCIAAVEAGF